MDSYRNMEMLFNKYCQNWGKDKKIYDIGSFNVNGTYRFIFEPCTYIGIDLQEGDNVDRVMVSEYDTGLESICADAVISGQCIEHCKNPFKLVKEMFRICKNNGYLFLIAPFVIGEHKYPIDCWRFLPDGYQCLFEEAGFTPIEIFLTGTLENGLVDCVGVAQKLY